MDIHPNQNLNKKKFCLNPKSYKSQKLNLSSTITNILQTFPTHDIIIFSTIQL
jgi:hypothetical protein